MPPENNLRPIQRRRLIAGAASLVVGWPSLSAARKANALEKHSNAKNSVLVYVGTYSSPQGPEGSKGNGEGIYLFEMDRVTGALTKREVFKDGANPSWLALHPTGRFLYAVNEVDKSEEGNSGAISAFSIDRSSGHLSKLNTVSSRGAGPAHVSVHPSGRWVFAANYAGGTFSVLPVLPDGRLEDAVDVQREQGNEGPTHAESAPPGSFAISGHDRPHAHMIEPDPSGNFVLGCDLGLDQIRVWKFDSQNGRLTPADTASVSVAGGDGPRHLVFHPNGRWFYSLQEEGSTVVLFSYDPSSGKLTPQQRISTLPAGFAGTNFTSEIRISSDGRFLYVANRLHDTIAFFSIGLSGLLELVGEVPTRGDYPRSFTIDPTGNYLYCCNQRSDAITTFRVNRNTGDLTFTGSYTPVGTPAIVLFIS
jgi:6-phosphogluconolactonase